jgi:thiol:disulfide interchange protein
MRASIYLTTTVTLKRGVNAPEQSNKPHTYACELVLESRLAYRGYCVMFILTERIEASPSSLFTCNQQRHQRDPVFMPKILSILFSLWVMLCGAFVHADALSDLTGKKAEFLPVEQAYRVSITVEQEQLHLDWLLEPGYYLYRDKFKFSQLPDAQSQPGAQAQVLTGVFAEGKQKYDEYFQKDLMVYYTSTRITLPTKDLPDQFDLKVTSQGCADAGLCYAPRSQNFQIDRGQGLATEITTKNPTLANTTPAPVAAKPNTGSFWLYLAMAMVGGMILNLMPCVFPVLSLKALGLAASGGSDHRHHLHGWAYTLGVIGSFVVAALAIIAAKTAGEQSGWGFQLQSPAFVAILTYLFLVMGLSLSGMVYFGTTLMGVGQGLTAQDGLRGSFFTGVLAAVVASPCTGPMMAPALGFALTQSTAVALAIFVALGFGMALPFLLLSYSPKLASMLPRPGVWMEKMKELLAFPMYLTAAWLLFVFGRQVGMLGVFFLLLGAVAIVFAIWLFQNQPNGQGFRTFVKGTAFIALIFAGYVVYISDSFRNQRDEWQPYSKKLVAELRASGQPVLVDFTADWCITCKVNKSVALSGQSFLDAVKKHDVALVRGDWTYEDPAISEVLTEFARSGVPLYLVYPADPSQPPEILPQLLSPSVVIEAIERASSKGLATF